MPSARSSSFSGTLDTSSINSGGRRVAAIVVFRLAGAELPGRGVDQHERADELGMAQRELLRDEAAVGVAEQEDAIEAERTGERRCVVGELFDGDRLDRRSS